MVLFNSRGEECIWVLDPLTRKLQVPLHLIVTTQATSTCGSVPSLCLAYIEGRCRHAWCRQAHVSPHAIHQLRHEALNAPTCCVSHGDPHDISILSRSFATVTISDSPHIAKIPVESVALTVGLQRFLVLCAQRGAAAQHQQGGGSLNNNNTNTPKQSLTTSKSKVVVENSEDTQQTPKTSVSIDLLCPTTTAPTISNNNPLLVVPPSDGPTLIRGNLEVPSKLVCRLHLVKRCRYLEDCNNVHLCRELDLRLHPPPHVLQQFLLLTSATRSICLGDTVYSVQALASGDISDADFSALLDSHGVTTPSASAISTPLQANSKTFTVEKAQQQQTAAPQRVGGSSPPVPPWSVVACGILKTPPIPLLQAPPTPTVHNNNNSNGTIGEQQATSWPSSIPEQTGGHSRSSVTSTPNIFSIAAAVPQQPPNYSTSILVDKSNPLLTTFQQPPPFLELPLSDHQVIVKMERRSDESTSYTSSSGKRQQGNMANHTSTTAATTGYRGLRVFDVRSAHLNSNPNTNNSTPHHIAGKSPPQTLPLMLPPPPAYPTSNDMSDAARSSKNSTLSAEYYSPVQLMHTSSPPGYSPARRLDVTPFS